MQESLLQSLQPNTVFKMDRLFVNALTTHRLHLFKTILQQSLLSIFLLTLILLFPPQETQQNQLKVKSYLTKCFYLSLIFILVYLNRLLLSNNVVINLQIAYLLNHTTQHPRDPTLNYALPQNLLSPTYDATSPHLPPQPIPDKQSFIQSQIFYYYFWKTKFFGALTVFTKYPLAIICILNQINVWRDTPGIQRMRIHVFIYTGLQLILLLQEVVMIFFILLLPLLCLLGVLNALHQMYKNYRNEVKMNLQGRVYSGRDPGDRELPECAICYMGFAEGDSICRLRCPGGHTFHMGCIESWVKVQKICPICRFNLLLND